MFTNKAGPLSIVSNEFVENNIFLMTGRFRFN